MKASKFDRACWRTGTKSHREHLRSLSKNTPCVQSVEVNCAKDRATNKALKWANTHPLGDLPKQGRIQRALVRAIHFWQG